MRLIVTADWHLRADRPRCRLDEDWIGTQRKAIDYVYQVAEEKAADVVIVGDLFHWSQVPSSIVCVFLEVVLKRKTKTYILAGNHDLPYHSWSNVEKSSFGIVWSLATNDRVNSLRDAKEIGRAAHFGMHLDWNDTDIVFIHELTFRTEKEKPYKSDDPVAADLLKKYKKAKWIFTGCNHTSFLYEQEGRRVMNPGCLLVQSADLISYDNGFWFVDTNREEWEWISYKDDEKLVTDAYLKEEIKRDERIEAFVESILTGKEISLSFEDNLRDAVKRSTGELGEGTIKIIEEIMEESRNV